MSAVAVLLGWPSGPARAAVLLVNNQVGCSDSTGAPYCTINAAVAKAVAGDTVSVASGNYSGKVTVDHSGTSTKPITIAASSGVTLTSTAQGFDLSGVSWVTVDGFTVDSTVNESFRCTLCSNVTLSNNMVTKSRSSGIYINNSSDTVLSNNRVEDSLNTGIDIAGSTTISILGGYVTRSGLRSSGKIRNGIKFSTTSASLVDGTQVYDNSDIGVYVINGSTGIRIKRVVAHHNARAFERIAAGIEFRSGGNIVESSMSYQNEDSGINMRWGGSDGLMVNNVTYLNGDHGIDVLESPRPTIINNSVYKNVTSGINIEGNSAGGYVYNNISVDNALNTTRKKGNINIGGSSATLGADYNLVSACCGSVLYVYKGTTYTSLAALKAANPGVETHGIQALPGWVSADTNDYHLTAGSVAIDSAKSDAIATAEIDRDVEGNARCDNSGTANTGSGPITYMDRGAYEYANSCATTDTTPPSVPANLSGLAVSPTQVDLIWTASTDDVGVTGYRLYRDGILIATVTGTNYSDTELTASTTYSYTVAAFDAAGNTSDPSSAFPVTTPAPADTTAPSVPANLSGLAVSPAQVDLTWTASTDDVGVTGYKLFRDGSLIATLTGTSYSDTGLTANTTYSYTVAAFDAAGNTSDPSAAIPVTTPADTTAPSVPANLAGSAVSPTQVDLTWTASTDDVGVTGYKLFRDGNLIATVTGTSYSDTGLTADTTYSYTVAAFDAAGNTSDQSSAVPVTTPPVSTIIVWEGRVSASSNDAEESSSGVVNLTSTDLELVLDTTAQTVGMRFANILVPKGAIVTNAYIQFQVDEVSTATATLTIQGVAADSATAFTTTSGNVSSRPRTGAAVPWTPASWPTINVAGAAQRTPNLAPVIQEIANRGGWASGNALAIIITGTGKRVAEAYDGAPAAAPLLHIDWTTDAPDTTPPSVSIASPTQDATISGVVTITANAADDTAVQNVQFRLGSANRCTPDTTAPYTCALDTRLESNGVVSLSAVATDTAGNQTVSDAVTVTVDNSTPPPSGTIRVPENYATIQAAINAAQNGNTVLVAPGTYAGGITITGKTITLASYFHSTGDPSYINTTTISGGTIGVNIAATSPNVIVKGFRFSGGTDSLVLRAPGGQSISNFFDHAGADALSFELIGGIARDNTCIGAGDDCIDADVPTTDLLIENNVLEIPNDDGIEIRNEPLNGSPVPLPTLVTVTIRGNKITGTDDDGIQLIDAPGTQNRRFVIERNLIRNSGKVGLGLMDNGVTVEDYRAASMPERIHVFNNTFDGNRYGITGGDNLVAVNNIISRSSVLGLKNIDAASIVARTLFWSNAQDQVGSNIDLASTISGNPLYTSSWGLGLGSPAIDAGTATYTHNGETVLSIPPSAYVGSAPDLGRYEFGM